MELVSCHVAHFSYVTSYMTSTDSNSKHHKFHGAGGKQLFLIKSGCLSSRYCHQDHVKSKIFKQRRFSQVFCCVNSYEGVGHSVVGETHILSGEENGVIGSAQSVSKVVIPGLPDEESGDGVAPISSYFWEWKPKLTVHYETSGTENVNSPPILFLPGFGVGSFHYEKQLKDLGRRYRTWAVDFLGQGMSLPLEDPTLQCKGGNEDRLDVWGFGDESEDWAEELVFSVDLWQEQVHDFVDKVVKEPVYIVGNSLGGFVALYFAALHPELVKGVILLNATPFWGLLPNPERSPRFSRLFPWSGTFPLPYNIKRLIEILWQKLSDPKTIAGILRQVYVDHSIKVDEVFRRIVETTQHPAAAASFASIMFAPQGRLSFNEILTRCGNNNTDVCLIYGKDDPWVRPIWGLQVKRKLPNAPYYEISPAGHCPHDEVPEVVNYVVHGWIQNVESDGFMALPFMVDGSENGGRKQVEYSRKGIRKVVEVQLSNTIWSWVKSRFDSLPLSKISFQLLAKETAV